MWRIRIDTAAKCLAMEVRDADLLLASFYTLRTADFALEQLAIPQAQAWWQGLEDTQGGLVYLHGYGDRKVGQHKGITAWTGTDSKVKWEQPELAFYGVTLKGILAYPAATPEEAFQLLDSQTGKVIKKSINQQDAARQVEAYSSDRYVHCVFPVVYLEGEAYFDQVRDFLKVQLGIVPVRAIEYAETESGLVIGFYVEDDEAGLMNFVALFDLEGNLKLKEKLGSGLSGIGSDTFFIFNLKLYFLQDKHVLKVYQLLA